MRCVNLLLRGWINIKKIVLNEVFYIKEILTNRNTTVSVCDMPYVLGTAGKYLYQREKLKPKQIKEKLYELASRLISGGGDSYKELIDKIASGDNKKVPINEIDYISITESEIETVKKLSSSERKIAFTLLCLAKYRNAYIDGNSNWETYEFIDIFNMANSKVSAADRGKIINKLVIGGYIKPSKKITNCNYQVLFVDDDSQEVLKITDFRDLGYTLLSYLGEEFDRCEICGRLIRYQKKKNHKKYCSMCTKKFKYNNSNNLYVPVKQRPIITYCSCCGDEMYINPSMLWLDSICDKCKDA